MTSLFECIWPPVPSSFLKVGSSRGDILLVGWSLLGSFAEYWLFKISVIPEMYSLFGCGLWVLLFVFEFSELQACKSPPGLAEFQGRWRGIQVALFGVDIQGSFGIVASSVLGLSARGLWLPKRMAGGRVP